MKSNVAKWGMLGLFLLSSSVWAKPIFREIYMPKNSLHLEDDLNRRDSSINEKEFNRIIDSVVKEYESVIAKHGGNLKLERKWTDPTVNASAMQTGKTWVVTMYGGLARRPEVTKDGFALVVCHELGHHLGGFYFYDKDGNSSNGWAACEGESDYFATQACARNIWADDLKENAKFKKTVDPTAKKLCDAQWKGLNDKNLCYRISAASMSLATLLAKLGGGNAPKFETPDKSKVPSTDVSHPEAQCRLDTYFQGGLCKEDFDIHNIPARGMDDQNGKDAEEAAYKTSCAKAKGDKLGWRPLCWFHPSLTKL